ncbi:MAG: carbon storage regulator CsrA [Planctomycetota bacterium]|jgi:carbon storage regulator
MLVLSRQKNEAIMIGDNIEIIIVDIRGDRVRLGITAPSEIPVHRKEVYEAIRRENIEASRTKATDLKQLDQLISEAGKAPPEEEKPKEENKQEREHKGDADEG